VPIATLADLSNLLNRLAVGQRAALPYSVYGLLFPPGEPDDDARVLAFGFAREHGCVIENQPPAQQRTHPRAKAGRVPQGRSRRPLESLRRGVAAVAVSVRDPSANNAG